jgi:hypothetical protein
MRNERIPAKAFLGRGVLAGLAGTVVMTAFQRLVEMPLSGREDSYAPPASLRRLRRCQRARPRAGIA